MKGWLIRKLGGFATIDEAIECIKEKDSKEKYEILTLAVKRLFNTISSDDILRESAGQWFYKDKMLSTAEKELLIAEATQFSNSKLWEILSTDIKWKANKTMYLTATTEIQLAGGKLWAYTIDCINTRLKSMRSKSGLYNK